VEDFGEYCGVIKVFHKKILVMGLPGSGKTTLAKTLAPMLHAVHFNADDIRKQINPHLRFSLEDRIEQARRIGWLCDQVTLSGNFVIADLVCPTNETRAAFGGCKPKPPKFPRMTLILRFPPIPKPIRP